MGEKVKGHLLIIGGAENKGRDGDILKKLVEIAGGHRGIITIITVASQDPAGVGREYIEVFNGLGVEDVVALDIETRADAEKKASVDRILKSTAVFFTGGDQLRITSLLGGTKLYCALHEGYREGVLIAGTSAGAAAMSDNMIVGGSGDETPQGSLLNMAPGMGLVEEVVIDQHFAQRGRLGRLLMAVAQNPFILGVGIDEDTSILVKPDATFEVIGSNTATVIDASGISFANVSELHAGEPLTLIDAKIHVLSRGGGFDMKSRRAYILNQMEENHAHTRS